MSFITKTETIFNGGGNKVDCYTLKNGKVICINEDMLALYGDMEDAETTILGDGQDLSIHSFYF